MLSKLKNKENVLKAEIENIKKETKNTILLLEFKQKDASLKQLELDEVMNTVTQHDLGHLLTFIKAKPQESDYDNTPKLSFLDDQNDRTGESLYSNKSDASPLKNEKMNISAPIYHPPQPIIIEEVKGLKDKKIEENASVNKISTDINKKNNLQALLGIDEVEEEESLKKEDSVKNIQVSNSRTRKMIGNGPRIDQDTKNLLQNEINMGNSLKINQEAKSPFQNELSIETNNSYKKNITEDSESLKGNMIKPYLDKQNNIKLKPVSSFLQDLEPVSNNLDNIKDNPSKSTFSKPSILEELEKETENNNQIFKPPVNKSIFNELNEDYSLPKKSIFQELEPGSFKNISSNQKLEFNKIKPVLNEPGSNFSIFETEIKPQDSIKPRGRDRSHLFQAKQGDNMFSLSPPGKTNFLDEDTEKKNKFNSNREGSDNLLFKGKSENENNNRRGKNALEKENSIDRIKSIAEKAEKNDFFGDFYDKTKQDNPSNIKSKLLPTKIESNDFFQPLNVSKDIKSVPVDNPKPKQASKIMDLDEEDLLL